MSLIHSLLATSYQPLRLGNDILRRLGAKTDGRLRVLNYHDIAPQAQEQFARQINWLSRSWNFVSPQQFSAMMKGDTPIKGANVLLTFDDGFASNLKVAKKILNPMGIRAVFFVVTDFVDLVEGDDFRAFVARYIHQRRSPAVIPAHYRNLTWNDLRWLQETGHSIGSHTRTHVRLSELKNVSELETEIIGSTDVLERNLGAKIEHFAYPFGDLSSFSPEALFIARRRFNYIYTGLRGDNARGVPSWCLRRDDIRPDNSFSLIGSFLEGGVDFRYTRSINIFESWGKSTKGNF